MEEALQSVFFVASTLWATAGGGIRRVPSVVAGSVHSLQREVTGSRDAEPYR